MQAKGSGWLWRKKRKRCQGVCFEPDKRKWEHIRGGAGGGGDWHCPRCKILVFASKTQCFLCHTAKTDFTAAQLAAAAAAADASTDKGKDKKKDGDAAPVAAVAVTRATVKNPRTILNEFCQKNKLAKLSISARAEKATQTKVHPQPLLFLALLTRLFLCALLRQYLTQKREQKRSCHPKPPFSYMLY